MKRTISSLSDAGSSLGKVLGNIVYKILLLACLLGQNSLPKVTRLLPITIDRLALVLHNTTTPALTLAGRILGSDINVVEAGWVVGGWTALVLDTAGSITTQRVEAVLRLVDGELGEIGTETVALGVLVGEGADL